MEKRRRVTIHALELLEQTGGQSFLLRVACSRGTYVRTLCQDIGEALGAPAHLSFLLRCASGPFLVEEAWTLEELWQLKEEGRLDAALLPACLLYTSSWNPRPKPCLNALKGPRKPWGAPWRLSAARREYSPRRSSRKPKSEMCIRDRPGY